MLLTDDFLRRWEDIVEQVEKQHIPISCVKKVVFRTHDKKQKTINLRKLRDQGISDDIVENIVEDFIRVNENEITSMEFVVDVAAVANHVQPETDKLLKDM